MEMPYFRGGMGCDTRRLMSELSRSVSFNVC